MAHPVGQEAIRRNFGRRLEWTAGFADRGISGSSWDLVRDIGPRTVMRLENQVGFGFETPNHLNSELPYPFFLTHSTNFLISSCSSRASRVL